MRRVAENCASGYKSVIVDFGGGIVTATAYGRRGVPAIQWYFHDDKIVCHFCTRTNSRDSHHRSKAPSPIDGYESNTSVAF